MAERSAIMNPVKNKLGIADSERSDNEYLSKFLPILFLNFINCMNDESLPAQKKAGNMS